MDEGTRIAQQLVDSTHDLIFDHWAQAVGLVVPHDRPVCLIASFLEDSSRRDVAGHVIGIGGHPQPRLVTLLVKPQGVINHNLATQKHDRQIISKGPHADGVIDRVGQSLAAVQPAKVVRLFIDGRTGEAEFSWDHALPSTEFGYVAGEGADRTDLYVMLGEGVVLEDTIGDYLKRTGR